MESDLIPYSDTTGNIAQNIDPNFSGFQREGQRSDLNSSPRRIRTSFKTRTTPLWHRRRERGMRGCAKYALRAQSRGIISGHPSGHIENIFKAMLLEKTCSET